MGNTTTLTEAVMAYYGYTRRSKQSPGIKVEGISFIKGKVRSEDRVQIICTAPLGSRADYFGCRLEKFGLRVSWLWAEVLYGEKPSIGENLFGGGILRRAETEFLLQYGRIKREKFRADIHG